MMQKLWNRFRLAGRVLLKGDSASRQLRAVPAITPDEVAEAREFFPLDKFFIYGHARSGTTLLTRLIRLHPDVHCNYQGHFFTRQPTLEGLVNHADIEDWFTRSSNRWNRGRDLSPVVLRAAADYIMEREARPLGAKIVGDKSPNNLLNGQAVDLAHKIYPDGRIVFIVRDGRDAAVSHRFQNFIDAPQHLSQADLEIRAAFERDPDPFLSGQRSIFTANAIRRAAEDWVRNVTETDARGRELYGDRYISLSYEDLLSAPWEQMECLWAFLGVVTDLPELPEILQAELGSNPDRDWQRQKAGELVSPLQKGKSGSWRDLFTERDKAIFREAAGEALDRWGYDWP